jgi:GH25 family lysozyme M1 (1,4-beta-N-acetylmuramidase)
VGASDASAAGVIDGPDVSSYQHPYGAAIKWSTVAKTGKEFAIVKATEGTSYVNPWFKTDYSRIRQVGMVRGSYHFARPAYPITSTALAQARYYVHRLGTTARMSRTLPPALDLEMTGGLAPGALVTWAQTFLLNVRRLTGRTPMLYTYPSFWSSALGDPVALARYPLWMASYSSGVDRAASLWQYTSTASVRGIRGSVDMSKLVATSASWKAMSDGRPRTSWPAAAPGAPQRVTARAAAGRATISWLPGDTGSTSVQHYRVTASSGGPSVVVAGTQTSLTMTGLQNGTTYTFSVRGINSVGAGVYSPPTAAVTPMVPTRLTTNVPSSAVYGKPLRVRATLTRPDTGAALAGRTLQVQTRQTGTSTWSDPVQVVTDSNGRAVASLTPATDVDVRVSFNGPVGYRPAHVRSTVLVATAVTSSLSMSEVPVNTPVVISGTIDPATAGVPVTAQVWRNGSWQTLQTSVTDTTGAFAFAYTPVTAGVKHYRVVVGAFGGREAGTSPTLTLTVDAPPA